MFKTIGYTGTRHAHLVPANLAGLVQQLSHLPALVGCAAGADQVVRQLHPAAQVFQAANRRQGWQLARRSIAMVQALAASPVPALVIAPGSACPASVAPSAAPGRCFNGSGSGTWATAAYAAGLDIPIFIIGQPPAHWLGNWRQVTAGPLTGLWQYQPPVQLSLF